MIPLKCEMRAMVSVILLSVCITIISMQIGCWLALLVIMKRVPPLCPLERSQREVICQTPHIRAFLEIPESDFVVDGMLTSVSGRSCAVLRSETAKTIIVLSDSCPFATLISAWDDRVLVTVQGVCTTLTADGSAVSDKTEAAANSLDRHLAEADVISKQKGDKPNLLESPHATSAIISRVAHASKPRVAGHRRLIALIAAKSLMIVLLISMHLIGLSLPFGNWSTFALFAVFEAWFLFFIIRGLLGYPEWKSGIQRWIENIESGKTPITMRNRGFFSQ